MSQNIPMSACVSCCTELSPEALHCPACFTPTSLAPKVTEEIAVEKPKKVSAKTKKDTVLPTFDNLITSLKKARENGRKIALGVDPGATYTGISIRDEEGGLYYSSTRKRNTDIHKDPTEWSNANVEFVNEILGWFNFDVLAVETVVEPTGFKGGKNQSLNPKFIIFTALCVGALVITLTNYAANNSNVVFHIIRPRNNGSRELSSYPEAIKGRRPIDLPGYNDVGVTTRDHEKSAYDVAGTALERER